MLWSVFEGLPCTLESVVLMPFTVLYSAFSLPNFWGFNLPVVVLASLKVTCIFYSKMYLCFLSYMTTSAPYWVIECLLLELCRLAFLSGHCNACCLCLWQMKHLTLLKIFPSFEVDSLFLLGPFRLPFFSCTNRAWLFSLPFLLAFDSIWVS